jgi:hypothetical protein
MLNIYNNYFYNPSAITFDYSNDNNEFVILNNKISNLLNSFELSRNEIDYYSNELVELYKLPIKTTQYKNTKIKYNTLLNKFAIIRSNIEKNHRLWLELDDTIYINCITSYYEEDDIKLKNISDVYSETGSNWNDDTDINNSDDNIIINQINDDIKSPYNIIINQINNLDTDDDYDDIKYYITIIISEHNSILPIIHSIKYSNDELEKTKYIKLYNAKLKLIKKYKTYLFQLENVYKIYGYCALFY